MGLVYVNGLEYGGTTYAVDERSGALVWSANTFDGSQGTVAVAGGVVYDAEACEQVSAFDAYTGALLWNHSTSCTGGGGTAPAFHQGAIWARDATLGNVILDTNGNVIGSFRATAVPSFYGGTAFYLSSGTLNAVDIQNDTQQWSFVGDGQLCTSAVIAGSSGQVFVGSMSGNVYEVEATTGAQISVADAGHPVTCGSEIQSIALTAGYLLVPTGDALVTFGERTN
jgi:outer membrane protein assembly factor BamB